VLHEFSITQETPSISLSGKNGSVRPLYPQGTGAGEPFQQERSTYPALQLNLVCGNTVRANSYPRSCQFLPEI